MHLHDFINLNHLFGGGLVAKSCPTLEIPGLFLPISSVHGTLQARVLGWVAISSPGIFPTQESNPGLLHCKQMIYQLSYEGSPNHLFKHPISKYGHIWRSKGLQL